MTHIKTRRRSSNLNAHHEYGLRLNEALQEAPDSEKLLNLRSKWDNNEYRDDWARYKDLLDDRKADTRTETETTVDYDGSKKFVSLVAPLVEIALGKENISNEERFELIANFRNFSLAFYDIIDITPGSNSDFILSLPIDVAQELRQSKSFPKPHMENELLEKSLTDLKCYIADACTRTPDSDE
ncbi:14876_t:CDS:2, partial [Acaulospora colombiana]